MTVPKLINAQEGPPFPKVSSLTCWILQDRHKLIAIFIETVATVEESLVQDIINKAVTVLTTGNTPLSNTAALSQMDRNLEVEIEANIIHLHHLTRVRDILREQQKEVRVRLADANTARTTKAATPSTA